MQAIAKSTKQSVKIGDWVKTERGRIFEVVDVLGVDKRVLGPSSYGPHYIGEGGGSALACAVVEIRCGGRQSKDREIATLRAELTRRIRQVELAKVKGHRK